MKLLSFLLTCLFFVCIAGLNAQTGNDKSKSLSKGSMDAGSASMDMPYTAMYSSKFAIGDPKYSAIVLNAWKAYDDNMLDKMDGSVMSDTLSATLPDGTEFKGKENFMSALKTYRGSFTS